MPYGIGRSFPVITAKTPGRASAFEASIRLINACGTCDRSSLLYNMRGNTMSSANFVWPTHFARASTLRNGLPTTFNELLSDFFTLDRKHSHGAVHKLRRAYAPPPTPPPHRF